VIDEMVGALFLV